METIDDLIHSGVKGMRWGVKKDRSASEVSIKASPGKKLKASGGKNHSAHDDAIAVAKFRQKAKGSSIDSLSNHELERLVKRMNLERQFRTLKIDRASPGAKFVGKLIADNGRQQVNAAVSEQFTAARKKAMS